MISHRTPAVRGDRLADRIDTWKNLGRQRFAHEHATRRGQQIARVERASFEHANADGLEVVPRDHSLLRRDVRPRRAGERSTEHLHAPLIVRTRGGELGHAARRDDTGNRFQATRHFLVDSSARERVVPRIRKVQLEREHVVRAYAEVELAQSANTGQKQSGRGHENERERDLRHDEQRPQPGVRPAAGRRSSLAAQRVVRIRAARRAAPARVRTTLRRPTRWRSRIPECADRATVRRAAESLRRSARRCRASPRAPRRDPRGRPRSRAPDSP